MKCSEYHFLARLFLGVKFVSIRCAGFSTTSFGSVRKRVSMICRNGAQLTARSIDGRSVAAKGFFSLFYQWSQTGCLAGRNDGCRYASSQCSSHGEALAGRLVANKRQYSSQSTQKPHSLSEPLRHLMRSLPAPIVVLTTTLPATDTSKDKKAHYRGMTLSSFTTLTLTPEPIVTFNIRSTPTEPSRTLAALEQSHNLLVHLLEDTAEGAGIAHGFTRGNEGDVFSTTKASVSEERTEYGLVLPRLTGKGIRRVLRCEILQQDESGNRDQRSTGNNSGLIRVGDHVLVVAQVKEILDSGLDPGTELAEGYGLSYADGKYRRVGDVIDPINYAAGL